jgi:acetyl-CoA carboxylase carboxyl transferase subunit beta
MAFINIFDRLFKGEELQAPGVKQLLKQDPTAEETCPSCKETVQRQELVRNLMVCPKCGKYMRLGARDRITLVSDKDAFSELNSGVTSKDFLGFPGYADKLRVAKEKTGENCAVVTGVTKIGGERCAVFAMDSRFIMASMGSAVGEKLTRIFEYATEKSLPVVGFTASGGARMQEGIVSLMQMAKVSGAVKNHSNAGNLYITVLTDPTTGGVTASFAMQGDIILAEPKALVGFAGRRVVEQTTGKGLPDNFQSAEFITEHGFADAIVPREEMRKTLTRLLAFHNAKEVRK